jgi:hypothetical protein
MWTALPFSYVLYILALRVLYSVFICLTKHPSHLLRKFIIFYTCYSQLLYDINNTFIIRQSLSYSLPEGIHLCRVPFSSSFRSKENCVQTMYVLSICL